MNDYKSSKDNNIEMLKYLTDIADKFKLLKSGIEKNQSHWDSFNQKSSALDEHIKEIYSKGTEVEELRNKLSEKLSEARMMRSDKRRLINKLITRAEGIHIDEPEKLTEYGIEIK